MKPIITSSPTPNLINVPDVNFQPDSFDELVYQKGYDVIHERAVTCPCRSKSNSSPLSTCQNCGGSGWVFINPTGTKMVLQSLTMKTKFSEWSRETMGTITVTSRSIDQLGYMDRITIRESQSLYSQVIYPILYQNQLFVFTAYDIKEIKEIFLFEGENIPLRRLTAADFSFVVGSNKIIFDIDYSSIDNLTFSIRYNHFAQYMIIELGKEFRLSTGVDPLTGYDKVNQFPFNGIARRSHYILDPSTLNGGGIIDNSYLD